MGHGMGVGGGRGDDADHRAPGGSVARVPEERRQGTDGEQRARGPRDGVAQGPGPAHHGGEGDESHGGVQGGGGTRERRGDRDGHRPAPTQEDRHEKRQPHEDSCGVKQWVTLLEKPLMIETCSQCDEEPHGAQDEQAQGSQNPLGDLEGTALRRGQGVLERGHRSRRVVRCGTGGRRRHRGADVRAHRRRSAGRSGMSGQRGIRGRPAVSRGPLVSQMSRIGGIGVGGRTRPVWQDRRPEGGLIPTTPGPTAPGTSTLARHGWGAEGRSGRVAGD